MDGLLSGKEYEGTEDTTYIIYVFVDDVPGRGLNTNTVNAP